MLTNKQTNSKQAPVVVEEVEVDEEVKSSFRRKRVEEEAGDGPPHMETGEEEMNIIWLPVFPKSFCLLINLIKSLGHNVGRTL